MLNQQKGALPTGQSCHTFDPFLPQMLQIEPPKKKEKHWKWSCHFPFQWRRRNKEWKRNERFEMFGLEPSSASHKPVAAHRKSWRTTESWESWNLANSEIWRTITLRRLQSSFAFSATWRRILSMKTLALTFRLYIYIYIYYLFCFPLHILQLSFSIL